MESDILRQHSLALIPWYSKAFKSHTCPVFLATTLNAYFVRLIATNKTFPQNEQTHKKVWTMQAKWQMFNLSVQSLQASVKFLSTETLMSFS